MLHAQLPDPPRRCGRRLIRGCAGSARPAESRFEANLRRVFAFEIAGGLWTAAADGEAPYAAGNPSAAAPAVFSIVRREGLVLMDATTKRAPAPGVKRKWVPEWGQTQV